MIEIKTGRNSIYALASLSVGAKGGYHNTIASFIVRFLIQEICLNHSGVVMGPRCAEHNLLIDQRGAV